MITLKQLANKLNVSVSTVSKALNNSDEISEETINKIQNLAKELKLNYIETSAFSSNNIDIAFFHTAKQILENIRNNKTIIDDKNGIKLGYQHTNNYIEKYKYEENNVCC